MAFGLVLLLISAGSAIWPVTFQSESQWDYRAGLGAGRQRANLGAGLVALSWALFFGTFVLGALSAEPLRGWAPAVGVAGWVAGAACGAAGLGLRRADPERAHLVGLVFLWGACAVDSYVRDVMPTVPFVVFGAAMVVAVLVGILLRHHRRRTPPQRL